MSQRTWSTGTAPREPAVDGVRVAAWAASVALETGLLHVLACADHFREWWGYGVFFLIVALCQVIGGAALLLTSNRTLFWIGLLGTACVLVIWALSRTVGAPIGPDGVGPESIGLLDAACTILEVVLVGLLARLLRRPEPAPLAWASVLGRHGR